MMCGGDVMVGEDGTADDREIVLLTALLNASNPISSHMKFYVEERLKKLFGMPSKDSVETGVSDGVSEVVKSKIELQTVYEEPMEELFDSKSEHQKALESKRCVACKERLKTGEEFACVPILVRSHVLIHTKCVER